MRRIASAINLVESSKMRAARNLGLDMRSRQLRRCGLCGNTSILTRSHVPPQTAGNDAGVSRMAIVEDGKRAFLGRRSDGGLWVRGLCGDCNNLGGRRYDTAYGDFAKALRPYGGAARHLLVERNSAPAVLFAPGLVSRAILHGMHALSPHLREKFPILADQLAADEEAVRLPPGLRLRVALTYGLTARVSGAVHAQRVLDLRETYYVFAEVFFPPLAWALCPPHHESILDRERWVDATDWVRYSRERTSVDLRNIASGVPIVQHPLHQNPDDWVYMFSDKITPLLEGRLPH